MCVNISEATAREIAPGVNERKLRDPEQLVHPGFGVRHYVLNNGGKVVFEEPLTEYIHYIISGCAFVGQGVAVTSFVHQETAVFHPARARGRHSFTQIGEGELRIITFSHKVPRPVLVWGKTRTKNLFEVLMHHQDEWGYTQPFSEEELSNMGALRFHGFDIQTHPGHLLHGGRIDPKTGKWIGSGHAAEALFFLRGHGEAMEEGKIYPVSPGSFCFSRDHAPHGINNSTDDILQYICLELIEHDKMWSGRGYQPKQEHYY
jgi:mannose-6-phosphate isomerase-like protein (cupin superfamily)